MGCHPSVTKKLFPATDNETLEEARNLVSVTKKLFPATDNVYQHVTQVPQSVTKKLFPATDNAAGGLVTFNYGCFMFNKY